ncbi:hypothetical protein [Vibrio sp. B1FLJ16]|uniref:hypothetical protein n=1 Tax=Vibrio sp. B1FLJ16 TaxID=2751178 RepID=UPI0015F3CF66|nr:hypothetical protein [Vibrio sp. B1FLJ16]CAD7805969.1 hypothetical protein ACOMICROBIO_EPCKBFOG_01459 [Vibrio sp. B1FLJ16]CAE6902057.1 hypothetical protein ACOMICROBIO_EPCKBFOG_01459 [Vibrio sp. B1FLJ16]
MTIANTLNINPFWVLACELISANKERTNMSNIDKITEEMETEIKRSKGGVFWRLLLVWMKEVNKQIQKKPDTDDELAEA